MPEKDPSEQIDEIRKAMGATQDSPLVTLMIEKLTPEERLYFVREVSLNNVALRQTGFLAIGAAFAAAGSALILKDGLAAAWFGAGSVMSAAACIQVYHDRLMIGKKLHQALGLE